MMQPSGKRSKQEAHSKKHFRPFPLSHSRGFLHQILLMFGLVVLLSACASSAAPTPTPAPATTNESSNPNTSLVPTATPLPSDAPQPTSGRTTVVGYVYDKSTNQPIKETLMFLAEVTGEGEDAVFIFNGASSPGAETDQEGRFMFVDVPAKSYVIVVGDPIGYNKVVQDETTRAKVWKTTANQVLDVGTILVDWTGSQ
jgi:hypothetical protein